MADMKDVDRALLQQVDALQPSTLNQTQQAVAFSVIQGLLTERWPEAEVHLFGSTATKLSLLNHNDLDICLQLPCDPGQKPAIIEEVAELMREAELQDIKAITSARIPLVKCTFCTDDMSVKVDVTLNNRLALANTRLLTTYLTVDQRLRQLVFVVKLWARRRNCNDAYRGTLSSYAWVLMCVFHLQHQPRPILPALQTLQPTIVQTIDDFDCSFCDDQSTLSNFRASNTDSLADLCLSFFRYWAWEFDYGRDAVSIRLGKVISKQSKNWNRRIGNERHLLGLEDPFVLSHDLGRTVDKSTMRFLRQELERAVDVLEKDPDPVPRLLEESTFQAR